jgi:hypothetical protein
MYSLAKTCSNDLVKDGCRDFVVSTDIDCINSAKEWVRTDVKVAARFQAFVFIRHSLRADQNWKWRPA